MELKTRIIDNEKEIIDTLQQIANNFPSTIRFPFRHRSGYIFNCAFSIMIGIKNTLLLYIADSTDKNRLKESEINFIDDEVCLFSGIQNSVLMFKLHRSVVNRITDKEEIKNKYISTKYNFDSKVMTIQPALSSFKENLLNRTFFEFIEIDFPIEIHEQQQRRRGDRCPIPINSPISPVIANGLQDKASIFNDVYLEKNEKAELTRYWNQATNEIKPLSKVLLDFITNFPAAMISFYFSLENLIGEEATHQFNRTKKITSDYPSFKSIKTIIKEKENSLYSEPRFIHPLFIHGNIEGHVIFMNTTPERRAFFRKVMFIFSKALERTKYFDIYSRKNCRIADLGTNGLRFFSTVPAHARLKKSATFLMEFNLNWATQTPIKIGVRVVDMSSAINTVGIEEFDIKCTFEKDLNFNENSIYRISKYVKDHINYTYR